MKLILNFFYNIYNNKKSLLLYIFILSILVSLIFLIFFRNVGPEGHRIPGTDYSYCYKPFALNLLEGKGTLIQKTGEICAPPGYPIFLMIVFSFSRLSGVNELDSIVVFNAILMAFSTCFLFLIAQSIFNKRIALISSILWLSYPFNQWFVKNPNTEVPFIFLLFIGIWLYLLALKKRHLGFILLVGIILGFAILIRPAGLFLPFLFALMVFFLLREYPKWRKCLLVISFLMGIMIAILPWEMSLFSKTGRFILLADGGTSAAVVGLTFALRETQGGDRATVPNDVLALMEKIKVLNSNTAVGLFNFLIKELIQKPIPLLKLIGFKIVRSWYATGQMWWEGKILAVQIVYLLTAFGGLIYGIRAYKNKIQGIIFSLSIIFYFWTISVLSVSILRYMVPAMGIVVIFSAILIDFCLNKLLFCFSGKNYDSPSLSV